MNSNNFLYKLKNKKYLITLLFFLVWVFVFDSNNILKQFNSYSEIIKLENEKRYYLSEIDANKNTILELIGNIDNLDKFAREKYLMKKENEDVYLIIFE